VGSFQSDCTKVVALYTSFDFVTKFLVEYSLDHAKFGQKVHHSSLTVKHSVSGPIDSPTSSPFYSNFCTVLGLDHLIELELLK
jgi:hypothetical protein